MASDALPCILQARGLCGGEEYGWRNVESLAELLDVPGVQLALTGEHFGDNALSSQVRGDIAKWRDVISKTGITVE